MPASPTPQPKVLLLGATGTNGKLLFADLLQRGCSVRAVARNQDSLPSELVSHAASEVVQLSLLDTGTDYSALIHGCDCVVSCLGHNMSFRGLCSRSDARLCTRAVRGVLEAAEKRGTPLKFVLHSSAGCSIPGDPPRSRGDRTMLTLLRCCITAHIDNERALDELRTGAGPNVEWVAVRPDDLIGGEEPGEYHLAERLQNGLFDAKKTRRRAVASFMASLVCDRASWAKWKGKAPMIWSDN